jgi:hypothetical protein
MSLPSSSTSHSDSRGEESPRQRLILVCWTIFFLFALDLVTNFAFDYPDDPRFSNPGRLQAYFEYGRSVEGKFDAMTRPSNDESARILKAGWLAGETSPLNAEPGTRVGSDRMMVAIYGMSHARRLARAVERVSDDVTVRAVTAPAATPNWAYAAHLLDRRSSAPDAVVFSLLSATIPMINTMSNATAFFDQSRPYTQPRFWIENDELRSVDPLFSSVEDYRGALYDADTWRRYREQLERYDPYYDPLLFRKSALDSSALVRVLRRGYAISSRRRRIDRVYGREGFREKSEEVALLRRMVSEFASLACNAGAVPVVYIVNSFRYGDHLFRVLGPTLESRQIPFVSSHTVCSPSDPHCYLPDSHFLPEIDDRLARELIRVVDAARATVSPEGCLGQPFQPGLGIPHENP